METILLEIDIKNFWVFNWYYITAVMLSFTGVYFGIKNFFKKSSKEANGLSSSSNTNMLTVNIGNSEALIPPAPIALVEHDDFAKAKRLANILFIDDDKKFQIVKILANTGWVNTKTIVDLATYDDEVLRRSQIVFVDVQGVGRSLHCKDEGLGLALNIKNRYPQKKVVIYSAIQSQNIFHDAIQKVDFLLSKDAEPFEFISLIERFSKELNL